MWTVGPLLWTTGEQLDSHPRIKGAKSIGTVAHCDVAPSESKSCPGNQFPLRVLPLKKGCNIIAAFFEIQNVRGELRLGRKKNDS